MPHPPGEALGTMAALAHCLPTNVPGDFFVDRRCLDALA
jgi:hypothetical protein